jgi:hypothetical protein
MELRIEYNWSGVANGVKRELKMKWRWNGEYLEGKFE